MLGRLAEYLQLHRNILLVLAGVWLALLLGTLVRWVATSFQQRERREQRLASLETWWVLWFLFSTAVPAGPGGRRAFPLRRPVTWGCGNSSAWRCCDPQERRLFAPALLPRSRCTTPWSTRAGSRSPGCCSPWVSCWRFRSAVCPAGRPGRLHAPAWQWSTGA